MDDRALNCLPNMPIEDWQAVIAAWSERKGHWREFDKEAVQIPVGIRRPRKADPPRAELGVHVNNYIASKLALVHSEISEALEALRVGDLQLRFENDGKPVGFEVEIADVIIRALDVAEALGMDIGRAMALKMNYNESQKIRNGKDF